MSEATRPAKEATTRSSSSAVIVVMLLIIVLLPALYVLSTGPILTMIDRGRLNPEFWNGFYAPLKWLYDNVKLIQAFFDWYFELWR